MREPHREVSRLHEEGKRATKLYGDGASDSDAVFEALSEVGAEPPLDNSYIT